MGKERLACVEKLFMSDSAFSHSELFSTLYSSFTNVTGCKMSPSLRPAVREPQFLFHNVDDTELIAKFNEAVRIRETTTPRSKRCKWRRTVLRVSCAQHEFTSSPLRLGKSDQPYTSIGRSRRWHLMSHPAEPGSPTIMVCLGVENSRVRLQRNFRILSFLVPAEIPTVP